MTFEELWNHIDKRNPAMAADSIRISRDNRKKLCKAFYGEGMNSTSVNVFEQIFGATWRNK